MISNVLSNLSIKAMRYEANIDNNLDEISKILLNPDTVTINITKNDKKYGFNFKDMNKQQRETFIITLSELIDIEKEKLDEIKDRAEQAGLI